MLNGNYKLWRQGGGRGAFAHVFIEIADCDHFKHQFSVRVDPDDPTTILPQHEPIWFASVIAGCQGGVQALEALGLVQHPYHLVVRCVRVNEVDTQADALQAAAYLATVSAFHAEDRFQLIYQDRWSVVRV